MSVSPDLRVGIVDYLNSKPLAWSFLDGRGVPGYEAHFLPPARVAAELEAGRLDVGLIPSIEYQRIPGLEIVPGPCVASKREVRSVLLVSREPVARIRSIALDQNSRTSAALVRILCAERWGIEPELGEAQADIEAMLATSDAALVIGDPALNVDPHRWLTFDLAREWYDLTGLPFVFAFWTARRGLGRPGLERVLNDSLDHGLAAVPELAAESARELGLDPEGVLRYLTHNLHFRFAGAEQAGLSEFYRRARRHGLIDDVRGFDVRSAP